MKIIYTWKEIAGVIRNDLVEQGLIEYSTKARVITTIKDRNEKERYKFPHPQWNIK